MLNGLCSDWKSARVEGQTARLKSRWRCINGSFRHFYYRNNWKILHVTIQIPSHHTFSLYFTPWSAFLLLIVVLVYSYCIDHAINREERIWYIVAWGINDERRLQQKQSSSWFFKDSARTSKGLLLTKYILLNNPLLHFNHTDMCGCLHTFGTADVWHVIKLCTHVSADCQTTCTQAK